MKPKRYEDLEPHHKRLVDDGFPIDCILTEEEREAARASMKPVVASGVTLQGEEVPGLSALSQASQDRVLKLIKAGKFRPHWLEDTSIVEGIEERTIELSRRREEVIERLRSLPPKEKKPPKPEFGIGITIKVLK